MIEMPAQVADCRFDTAVDSRQRSVVRWCTDVLYDRGHEFTCGASFLIHFRTLGVEYVQLGCVAGFVGRLLHFCDDHAAKCELALIQPDIRSCQMTIGRNIAHRQLIEQVTDFSGHHHGKSRRDDHKDDQPDGDAYDLSLDRLPDHRCPGERYTHRLPRSRAGTIIYTRTSPEG